MGHTGRIVGIALLLGSGSLSVLVAQDDKIITALYVEAPIVIDGNLDEPQWSLAQPGGDFIQNEPRTGEPATEPTEVRLLYDDENLYIGVYCFDSAGKEGVTVTEVKRDYRPFDNDHFSFVLDTFDDNRNGICLERTPEEPNERVRWKEMATAETSIGMPSGM